MDENSTKADHALNMLNIAQNIVKKLIGHSMHQQQKKTIGKLIRLFQFVRHFPILYFKLKTVSNISKLNP